MPSESYEHLPRSTLVKRLHGTPLTCPRHHMKRVTHFRGNTLQYNANGNLITDEQGRTLIYDGWNRLIGVKYIDENQNPALQGFICDGMGRKAQDYSLDGDGYALVWDVYVSSSGQVLQETADEYTQSYFSGTRLVTRSYYSPVYINAILARDDDSNANGDLDRRITFTHDANFNVTGVVSTAGTMLQRQVYNSYGEVQWKNANWSNKGGGDTYALENLYQGMLYNIAIGWYFAGQSNQGRWYAPTLQVWTRPDDIGYGNGMNRYQFVAANPINGLDATGLQTQAVVPADATPRIIAQFGPGAANINKALINQTAGEVSRLLHQSGTGKKTLDDMTGNVRVFLTEKMSIWDRYRTRRQRRRNVWGPFVEERDAEGGESLPVMVNGKQEWHIYIRAGSSAKAIAELLVHETVHSRQTPGLSIQKEVEAYKAQAQWNIEMGNYTAGDIHQDASGNYVVNDPATIENRLVQDPLYNFQDLERRGLYQYQQNLLNLVTGQRNMDFDSGSWAVELGYLCTAPHISGPYGDHIWEVR